jgi:hypothetical protein
MIGLILVGHLDDSVAKPVPRNDPNTSVTLSKLLLEESVQHDAAPRIQTVLSEHRSSVDEPLRFEEKFPTA